MSKPAVPDGVSRALLDSPAFRRLVSVRWTISLALTCALFILYYGYILLIAVDRAFLSRRIGAATTLGIPLGAAVIVGAWMLTTVLRRLGEPALRRRGRPAARPPQGAQLRADDGDHARHPHTLGHSLFSRHRRR